MKNHHRDDFNGLFAASDDPWHFKSRWYEQRKRALTLACLPSPRFGSAYEPGCANGELSLALAPRCDRLLITDGAARAVELARQRCAPFAHVQARQAWLPDEWPDETFDLIVISELAYYLDASTLPRLARKALQSLNEGGVVLACHWRRSIDGCEFDGDEVHRRFGSTLDLPHLLQVVDADLRIDVWCTDARSVASREGLVAGPHGS